MTQEFQQLAIEYLRHLKMRHMAYVWDEHQLSARDGISDMLCERGKILAIPLSTQDQCLDLDVRPVVDDRIEICNLLIDGAHHGEARPVAAERGSVDDADVLLVLRLPCVREVALNIGIRCLPGLIAGASHGRFVCLLRAVPRLGPAGVGEADRIVEHDALGDIGVGGGEACGEHAAHGMSYDRGPGNTQRLQQGASVQSHVVEVIRDDRLRRTSPADLVGYNYAEAFLAQSIDRTAKVKAAKVHSVEQDDGSTVGGARGENVHVGHAHILAVEGERKIHHRILIRDVVVGDTARLYIRGSLR